jgi:hypothetical protein
MANIKLNNWILCISALLLSISSFSQIKVQGVTFPEKLGKEDKLLVLNGAGVRSKYYINVYVAGLYLINKNTNAKEIIDADKPTAVRLQIISSLVSKDKMADAIVEGFEKSTGGKTASIKKEIDMIVNIFKSEPIKVGDVFDIWYTPGHGVMASKNGKKYDMLIPGLQYKKYLFGIWLGEDPVDANLKSKMLTL